MSASYMFSMVMTIAVQLLLVAVLVAVFLLLLQLIKYFKSRNAALARENICVEQPKAAAETFCCTETTETPESGEEKPAE